jgi:hypothetical protein
MTLDNFFGIHPKQLAASVDPTGDVSSQSRSTNQIDSSMLVHFNPNIEAFINRLEGQAPKEVLGIQSQSNLSKQRILSQQTSERQIKSMDRQRKFKKPLNLL